VRYLCLLIFAAFWQCSVSATRGEDMVLLDPFARATSGDAGCPEKQPPLMTGDEARTQAHVRSERGLRCAMEGTCEPGGAYRRDPEINEQVRAKIAADPRFADTSIWVTTSRRWVTLQGCVRSKSQQQALVRMIGDDRRVERIFDELKVRKPEAPAHANKK
jgi:hypothetical protein